MPLCPGARARPRRPLPPAPRPAPEPGRRRSRRKRRKWRSRRNWRSRWSRNPRRRSGTPRRRSAPATAPTGARSRRPRGAAGRVPRRSCPAASGPAARRAPVPDRAGRAPREPPPPRRGASRAGRRRRSARPATARTPCRSPTTRWPRRPATRRRRPRSTGHRHRPGRAPARSRRRAGQTERGARLRVVVAQDTRELRRRQQHRREHIERVVRGGDGVLFRLGHHCLPIGSPTARTLVRPEGACHDPLPTRAAAFRPDGVKPTIGASGASAGRQTEERPGHVPGPFPPLAREGHDGAARQLVDPERQGLRDTQPDTSSIRS